MRSQTFPDQLNTFTVTGIDLDVLNITKLFIVELELDVQGHASGIVLQSFVDDRNTSYIYSVCVCVCVCI